MGIVTIQTEKVTVTILTVEEHDKKDCPAPLAGINYICEVCKE